MSVLFNGRFKMKHLSFPGRNKSKTRQHGVSLIIALLFLVILTILGIGVFSTTLSEERMARNFRDKTIALQGAEAAINEAKIFITGSYDASHVPSTLPKPLSEQRCYDGSTIPGFSCDPNISPVSLDLFSGSLNGAPLGTVDSTVGASGTSAISPTILGFPSSFGSLTTGQPRYLVVWQQPSACGTSNTGACFMIIAQSLGRLNTTRVNLVELFTY